jgi:RRXRR protein
MSRVLVVSPQRIPLAPCTPARARWLLTQKQAAVLRRFPFTLVLVREPPGARMPQLRLKIDPGSKTTGLAVVNDASGQVIWAGELTHRGQQVRKGLQKRRACRRERRQRHTRYRPRRFLNRCRRDGWLPPSLESRLANVLTWVARLQRWCPTSAINLELVKFDTQLLVCGIVPLVITAQGRHSRQMCRTTACGFPDKAPKATSVVGGYRSGDLVRAVVPGSSKKAGSYVGRIAVRATGSCNIQTSSGTIQGIHYRYCRPLHRADGYTYAKGERACLPTP